MSKKSIFVISSLAAVTLVAIQATSLYLLWNWFIPDQLSLPSLSFTMAFVLIMMTRIFSFSYKEVKLNMTSTEMKILQEQMEKAFITYAFNNLFIIIGGWIIHRYFL